MRLVNRVFILIFFFTKILIAQDCYWTGNGGDADFFNELNWVNTLTSQGGPREVIARTPHWESKPCKTKVALLDAQRALQMIAENAKKWNIDNSKIGIIGFSAGGHLAATLSNHFDFNNLEKSTNKKSYRPSFCILV